MHLANFSLSACLSAGLAWDQVHYQPSCVWKRCESTGVMQQERQPPWKQGSGDGKPLPCVSRHMQRKLGSQRSIEQRSGYERSGLSREQESTVQEQTAELGETPVPTPYSNLPRAQEETAAGTAEQTAPVSDSRCEDSSHMPVVHEQGAGTAQKGDSASYCPDKRCEDDALNAESGHLAARGSATDNQQDAASKEEADVATMTAGTDKQPDVAASKEEAVTGDKGEQGLSSPDEDHGTNWRQPLPAIPPFSSFVLQKHIDGIRMCMQDLKGSP